MSGNDAAEGADDCAGQIGTMPVCGSCGSNGVVRDAWAAWNPMTGLWELGSVFDQGFCRRCETTTDFVWKRAPQDRAAIIRDLNDALRAGKAADGLVVVTSGVRARGQAFVEAAASASAAFDGFVADNDPYGEHDFGAFEVEGEKLFFKIDAYDLAMQAHSPDAADPAVTRRVMTIMLASEY